jgi:hypothetical protein
MTVTSEVRPSRLSPPVCTPPAESEPSLAELLEKNPFLYGHRLKRVQNEAGIEKTITIPIQPKDFLNPQHGDHFVQGTQHDKDIDAGRSIIRRLHARERHTAVYHDLQMDWGIEGLSKPCPDIAVIPQVRDKERPRQSFDVQAEGTRPRGVIEFVSPNYVHEDYEDKAEIYEQAGVEEYIIIDSGLRRGSTRLHYRVSGYRLQGERYVDIEPDALGRIYSQVNNIWIATRDDPPGFDLFDGTTGALLLPDPEELEREQILRIQAQDRAEVAEEIAEQERVRAEQSERLAEQERLRAEQEHLARNQAETVAEQERLRAEQERLRAEQEHLARTVAEAQLAALKAQMRAMGIQVE